MTKQAAERTGLLWPRRVQKVMTYRASTSMLDQRDGGTFTLGSRVDGRPARSRRRAGSTCARPST